MFADSTLTVTKSARVQYMVSACGELFLLDFFQCSRISLSFISRTRFGNTLSEGDSTLPFPSLYETPGRLVCFSLTPTRNFKIMSSL